MHSMTVCVDSTQSLHTGHTTSAKRMLRRMIRGLIGAAQDTLQSIRCIQLNAARQCDRTLVFVLFKHRKFSNTIGDRLAVDRPPMAIRQTISFTDVLLRIIFFVKQLHTFRGLGKAKRVRKKNEKTRNATIWIDIDKRNQIIWKQIYLVRMVKFGAIDIFVHGRLSNSSNCWFASRSVQSRMKRWAVQLARFCHFHSCLSWSSLNGFHRASRLFNGSPVVNHHRISRRN